MLPQHAPAPQSAAPTISASPPVRIGVGIDTARYGHYAAFLRDDLQLAADELAFVETAAGYAQLRQRLERLAQRHGTVHFVIRLDAAGQYADNLLHFLHQLRNPDQTQLVRPEILKVPFCLSRPLLSFCLSAPAQGSATRSATLRSIRQLPHAHGLVVACRKGCLAVGREDDTGDPALMSYKAPQRELKLFFFQTNIPKANL